MTNKKISVFQLRLFEAKRIAEELKKRNCLIAFRVCNKKEMNVMAPRTGASIFEFFRQ